MYCTKCGHPLNNDANFCSNCRNSISALCSELVYQRCTTTPATAVKNQKKGHAKFAPPTSISNFAFLLSLLSIFLCGFAAAL